MKFDNTKQALVFVALIIVALVGGAIALRQVDKWSAKAKASAPSASSDS